MALVVDLVIAVIVSYNPVLFTGTVHVTSVVFWRDPNWAHTLGRKGRPPPTPDPLRVVLITRRYLAVVFARVPKLQRGALCRAQ